ncbi:YbaB/EbfC family nucleoid-associated protein [Nonomuraea sp. SBT364]|uniref:YbaB/EbfC family nucleoid-associated protein n=1 Tax=Nonomuraea sp. SBT364 TaxID=1580530 RepID=UPI00066BDC4B|nr:YbaB/EbfC family nucleoid-associated protein [Nonomuraea sp. SBT364]
MNDRDFGGIDPERILQNAERQMARVAELQQAIAKTVGRAEDEDGLVRVELGAAGLQELFLHPKAMRLTSGELAERVKATFAEAAADQRRQMSEAMEELYGEDNPMRFAGDPDGVLEQARQAEALYNKTFEDLSGQLDRIVQRMEG